MDILEYYMYLSLFFNDHTYFGVKPCSASQTTPFSCQCFLLPHSVVKTYREINK